MDTTLKQRLIGASVLIALAIIFIPMIFEVPNDTNNKSISIEIPNEPKGLQQKTISLDPKIVIEKAHSEKPIDNVISKQQKIIEVIDNSSLDTVQTEQIENNISDSTSNIDSNNLENSVDSSNVDSNLESIVDKQNTTELINENNNNIDDKINLTSQEDLDFSYRVKLGAFTLEKNAIKLKTEIINQGLLAEVQNNQERNLFEVYSNPFSTKDLAQSYSNKVQSLKLKIGRPSILTLTKEESKLLANQLAYGFVIQLGSFSNKENSIKLRDSLRSKGFVTFVDMVDSENITSFRVRVGPFVSESDAEVNKTKIKRVMNINGLVKPHELQQVVD
jgi:cell division septation protein DedD